MGTRRPSPSGDGGLPRLKLNYLTTLILTCSQIILVYYHGLLGCCCLDHERLALIKFREGLNDPLQCLSSWYSPNCCNWKGITCNNSTGYVVKLNLQNPFGFNNYSYWDLSGRLDPALSGLKHLEHLDLSGNIFFGIPIPEFFASFKELRYLNISNTGFDGRIPHQLGNLSKMEYLDLGGNNFDRMPFLEFFTSFKELRYLNVSFVNFDGGIPHQLGNLSKLEYLDISYNSFLHTTNLQWLPSMTSLKYLNMNWLNLSKVRDNWVHLLNGIPSLVELQLSGCSLSYIAPTLSHNNFTSLCVLDLSGNSFDSRIPDWIGNITSLTSLTLSGCSFHGPIPYSFAELPHLEYVNLWGNDNLSASSSKLLGGTWSNIKIMEMSYSEVSGEIPMSLANITTLAHLDLSWNKLVGSLPTTIGNLKNLEYLDLSNCMFADPIPESIGGLSSLQYLDLSGNQLNGSIPKSVGQLSKLEFLDLSSNSLEGTVTELHFRNLTELKILDLSSNQLVFDVQPDWVPLFQAETITLSYCILGPQFPAWLQTQKLVTILDISSASINDTLPFWLWDLMPQLSTLNLSNNQIDVQLPSMLEMCTGVLDLSSNLFRGPIPTFKNIDYLDISNNHFSGQIPPNVTFYYFLASRNQINGSIPLSISKGCYLQVLNLSHNKLDGQIPPSLGDCANLGVLDLGSNLLSGTIPSSLGLLSGVNFLRLRNNSLSGEIPLSLKNCSNLEVLDMGDNKLSGDIPTWISESLPSLRILSLRSNLFSGEIPQQLSTNLGSLQVIDLSHNLLTGPIPQSLGTLVAMQSKQNGSRDLRYSYDPNYQERLVLTMKGMELEYSRTLALVTCIDLSNNHLSGDIPKNLTLLLGLLSLNLSRNNLSGNIPKEIGHLVLLESLDLSRNLLIGEIPQSISNLTFLSYLNLSNNNLSGRIPAGHQLQTLNDPSIYSGNQLLCGDLLPKKCEVDETPQSPGKEDDSVDGGDGIEIPWLCIGMAPGFVFGFWVVLGTLMLKKSWRIALFLIIDEVMDGLLCGWQW